jgi:prepilin-type N-terminal cleavage/methylation domain-containing protein
MNPAPRKNAFTLLEVLLVVAAVGILAAIVIVAINPQRQLEKTRDAERQSEVNTLYDAIQQYNIDNNGYPSPVANLSDHEAAEICQDGTSDPSCINLTNDLVETYLAAIPSDPQASGAGSGYVVAKNGSRIRLEAVSAEVKNDVVTAGYTSNRLLDDYPFASAAYSVRLLNASHEVETAQSGNSSAGSYLVRIRQNNTNDDTADVLPDSNGELSANSEVYNTTNSSDGQTLGTWVGSNNAYVTAWYDQSVNAHNASQGTSTQQPQIYDGSSVITENSKPALDFDGSDDNFNANSLVINDTHAIFMVMNGKDGSGKHILDMRGDNSLTFALRENGSDYYVREQDSSRVRPTIDSAQSKQMLTSLVAQGEGNPVETYEDGAQVDSATVPTGNWSTTSMNTNIMRSRTGKFMKGNQQEMIFYNSNQSSNRSSIESNINDYFSIY